MVKMAPAPGVELVPELVAASEGEAEPRFRGSIWLRPPFPTIAHGSRRGGGGEADRQLTTEQEEKGRSRTDPRLAGRRELPPPELGEAGRAVEAGWRRRCGDGAGGQHRERGAAPGARGGAGSSGRHRGSGAPVMREGKRMGGGWIRRERERRGGRVKKKGK
jgi:hypothetical protein